LTKSKKDSSLIHHVLPGFGTQTTHQFIATSEECPLDAKKPTSKNHISFTTFKSGEKA